MLPATPSLRQTDQLALIERRAWAPGRGTARLGASVTRNTGRWRKDSVIRVITLLARHHMTRTSSEPTGTDSMTGRPDGHTALGTAYTTRPIQRDSPPLPPHPSSTPPVRRVHISNCVAAGVDAVRLEARQGMPRCRRPPCRNDCARRARVDGPIEKRKLTRLRSGIRGHLRVQASQESRRRYAVAIRRG